MPPKAAITMPLTGFGQEVESSVNVNQVEKHFVAYMNSGIRSRLPSWTRNHWTADKGGVKPKRDRRAGAFHEVSAVTVAPGPYWTGFHGVGFGQKFSDFNPTNFSRAHLHVGS